MADTIAAISTALQMGGIAVIRISGDEAIDVADKVFSGKKKLKDAESHKILYGKVYDEAGVIDECLCSVMKGPNSYTREDVIEINVHGGIISAQKTLSAVLKAGARRAKAGEFTMRAFMNGRMDLSGAEAVADIINSKTGLSQTAAVNQLEGKLAKGVNKVREDIIRIMGLISVSTDFPDEDADSLSGISIKDELKNAKTEIENLLENADKGIILREGAVCAICGKPNVGKSSLLNALSGKEKAIVTEIEGTTRDIIEEYINIKGVPVKIGDTAGIRENDDVVESIGVEKALQYIKEADLCLYVLDAGRPYDDTDREILEVLKGRNFITVLNKCELERKCTLPEEIDEFLCVSAKEGEGIDLLEDKIYEKTVGKSFSSESVMITNERHKEAAEEALEEVKKAIFLLESGVEEDIAVINLENAASALGEITGMTVGEEVVREIFSKFCIGK